MAWRPLEDWERAILDECREESKVSHPVKVVSYTSRTHGRYGRKAAPPRQVVLCLFPTYSDRWLSWSEVPRGDLDEAVESAFADVRRIDRWSTCVGFVDAEARRLRDSR